MQVARHTSIVSNAHIQDFRPNLSHFCRLHLTTYWKRSLAAEEIEHIGFIKFSKKFACPMCRL